MSLGPISRPVNVLRSVRAFRLIRVFRRLRALRDIVYALSVAVFPVLNAFLILIMIAGICALSACALFVRSPSSTDALPQRALLCSCAPDVRSPCALSLIPDPPPFRLHHPSSPTMIPSV